MNGRIVRLAAACLILAAAFVLYQQKQRNDLAAEMLAGGCHSPEAEPEKTVQGCSRLLDAARYKPEERAVLYIYRGRAHVKQEDLQRALQDFEDAAAFNADEHQAWQWVSYVLGELGEDEAAFDAIEKAHRLGPANTYTMQQRFHLLKVLERYAEADAYYTRLMEKYPAAEDERLLWMPRELGQMRLELKQYGPAAEVFREVYRLDLTHKKTAAGFFEACMFAGPDCPPLFPERRADYPVLSCDEALKKWAEYNPERLEKALRDTGAGTLTELVQRDDWKSKQVFQWAFLGGVDWPIKTLEHAPKFLIHHRVFECVNDGKVSYYEGFEQENEAGWKYTNEYFFSPQLRNNLIDLAQTALN
ncbi:tetratricopeptide repeat protein [Ruegeria sp. MALMAid1280]|uniref:tetratricopeptide repeat protein n=1 Tax=Ruegeria sp. MALMAid1280 TaxID=3411634 RepID=UPI003B9F52D1